MEALKGLSFSRWEQKKGRNLKNYLVRHGYNKQHFNHELQWVLETPRDMCLQSKWNQDKPARTPLVVTHHPTLPSFHRTTKHHLSTLHASEQLRKAFPIPLLIVFQCPRNLSNYLVRVALTPTSQELLGNRLCGAFRCKTCPILLATDEFSSHTTGQYF